MSEREFDVVVFGASGYTGKLVAEYIQSEYGENGSVKWAIAGRNREKLEGIREELGLSADLSILEVDSNDQGSLNAMTEFNQMCPYYSRTLSTLWFKFS